MSTENETKVKETKVQSNTKTVEKKPSSLMTIVAIVAIGLFVLASAAAIYFHLQNKELKGTTTGEKERYEKLMSEKLNLEKEVAMLSEDNKDMDRTLGDVFTGMAAKDVVIERLEKENVTLKQIKAQIDELQKIAGEINTSGDKLKNVQKKVNDIIEAKQNENLKLKAKMK